MAAKASSATSAEDSSMRDFGECTGCVKGERGGMRHDLQQSNPVLQQLPIGADRDHHLGEQVKGIILAVGSGTRL